MFESCKIRVAVRRTARGTVRRVLFRPYQRNSSTRRAITASPKDSTIESSTAAGLSRRWACSAVAIASLTG
ncbi:unnamed protein product [Nesidiocoris tenuis]|uniref:Uncharacterized protein n=1 Tax=Nesidiocoris tenuis TaxID=355587 RepID=A0A6H5HAE6_9HEMI|nr:unnamed protein product [Nesidiocoris tenuis]